MKYFSVIYVSKTVVYICVFIHLCVCVCCTYDFISLPHDVYIFVYLLMTEDILITMDHNEMILFPNGKPLFSKPSEVPQQLSSAQLEKQWRLNPPRWPLWVDWESRQGWPVSRGED